MNPAFKHNKLNSLIPTFVDCTTEMLQLWDKQLESINIIDVTVFMKNITFEVIGILLSPFGSNFWGKTAFGHEFRALHQETEEKKNLEFMFKGLIQPLTFLLGKNWTKIPTQYQKDLKKATMSSEKVIVGL